MSRAVTVLPARSATSQSRRVESIFATKYRFRPKTALPANSLPFRKKISL